VDSFYYEIIVKSNDSSGELLLAVVTSAVDEAIEFDDTKIIIRTENEPEEIIKAIKSENNSLLKEPLSIEFEVEKKRNIDWIKAYQDSISPIEAGGFYIHPQWYEPKKDKINILINPALAFGSGHHATTHSCLLMIDEFIKSGQDVLDVGCGSGILSLASAKKGANVWLCDTDEVAVDSSKENFRLNGESFRDIWVGSVNKTNKKYDTVLANIIADVLKAISKELKNRLKDEGILILSGILDKKESIVTSAFSDLNLIKRVQKDEWITLVYKKG